MCKLACSDCCNFVMLTIHVNKIVKCIKEVLMKKKDMCMEKVFIVFGLTLGVAGICVMVESVACID